MISVNKKAAPACLYKFLTALLESTGILLSCPQVSVHISPPPSLDRKVLYEWMISPRDVLGVRLRPRLPDGLRTRTLLRPRAFPHPLCLSVLAGQSDPRSRYAVLGNSILVYTALVANLRESLVHALTPRMAHLSAPIAPTRLSSSSVRTFLPARTLFAS